MAEFQDFMGLSDSEHGVNETPTFPERMVFLWMLQFTNSLVNHGCCMAVYNKTRMQ
jgi:hypothetical protein